MTMKIAINTPDDHTYSIMQRILDGSLAIHSPEEFQDILGIYPEDPFLYRKYADLLRTLKRTKEAAVSYETAAKLFIANGMNLQAIVAKILQWSIEKPGHDKGRAFHALLHEEGSRQTPLQRFWAHMTYPELVAVMRRLVRAQLPAGSKIIQACQPADDIYFVVAGTLSEMPSPDCESEARRAGIDVEPTLLGPNDVFGEVFPLDQTTEAETEIRAVSDVELVKISKPVLHEVCQKYPRIQSLLYQIHKADNRDICDRAWQTVRRAMRFGLPTRVEITCPPTSANAKSWHHAGIAVDLSMGGICVDLGAAALPGGPHGLKGRMAQLNIDLLNDISLLNISGKIVWQRRQQTPNGPAALIGIRFDTLNAMDRKMLSDYCAGSVGEQNLLWSLWDTMVKTDNPQ